VQGQRGRRAIGGEIETNRGDLQGGGIGELRRHERDQPRAEQDSGARKKPAGEPSSGPLELRTPHQNVTVAVTVDE
jgi:hypothetical protein